MAIGASKIGVMGGLVPGGSCTFNSSGTFIVPPGVRTLTFVCARGGSGNPGNPGNLGNSGNPGNAGNEGSSGSGGAGGPGAGATNAPSAPNQYHSFGTPFGPIPGYPNSCSDPAGACGGRGAGTMWIINYGNSANGSNDPAAFLNQLPGIPSAQLTTVSLLGFNVLGACECTMNSNPINAAYPRNVMGPLGGFQSGGAADVSTHLPSQGGVGFSGNSGTAGNAGSAGSAGSAGNPGNSTSAFGFTFPAGAGGNAGGAGSAGAAGNAGSAGTAGSGGTGGIGARAGAAFAVTYPIIGPEGYPYVGQCYGFGQGSGAAGGNGGGNGGGPLSLPGVSINNSAYIMGAPGGGGAGVCVNGQSGCTSLPSGVDRYGQSPSSTVCGGFGPPASPGANLCCTFGGLGGDTPPGTSTSGRDGDNSQNQFHFQLGYNQTYFAGGPSLPVGRVFWCTHRGGGGGGGGSGKQGYAAIGWRGGGGGGGGRGNSGNPGGAGGSGGASPPAGVSGGSGAAASFVCCTQVKVSPGSSCPITVGGPSGGQVIICWNPQ